MQQSRHVGIGLEDVETIYVKYEPEDFTEVSDVQPEHILVADIDADEEMVIKSEGLEADHNATTSVEEEITIKNEALEEKPKSSTKDDSDPDWSRDGSESNSSDSSLDSGKKVVHLKIVEDDEIQEVFEEGTFVLAQEAPEEVIFTSHLPELNPFESKYLREPESFNSACALCGLYLVNSDIYKHFTTNHQELTPILSWVNCNCFACRGSQFPTEADLGAHQLYMKEHNGNFEQGLERKLSKIDIAIAMESFGDSTIPGQTMCKYCQNSVEITNLHSHFRIKHIEAFVNLPWDLCTKCSIRFPSKHFLENHKCMPKSLTIVEPKKPLKSAVAPPKRPQVKLMFGPPTTLPKRKEASPSAKEPAPKLLKLTFPVPPNFQKK